VVGEAGLGVGVPQRVPHPGGELERQVAVPAGADHRGQLHRGREELRGQPADPELGGDPQPVGPLGGHGVEAGEEAPAERDLRVHVQVGCLGRERAQGAQTGLRVLTAAGDGRLDTTHTGAGGPQLGDRGGEGPDRGVVDDADRETARGDLVGGLRRGYEQRADQPRVPGPAVFEVCRERFGEPGDARRKQGRVVDESCEQRWHQR
jgi:hypothetical protein